MELRTLEYKLHCLTQAVQALTAVVATLAPTSPQKPATGPLDASTAPNAWPRQPAKLHPYAGDME